jgi:hypothetical protein
MAGVVISCTMDGRRDYGISKHPGEKPGHRQTQSGTLVALAAKSAPIPAKSFMLKASKQGSPFLRITGWWIRCAAL